MWSMVRSIRWRLQFWYAAVLAGVIGGFGGLIYWQSRAARFEQIDTQLLAGASYLDAVLRSFPPGELENPRAEQPDRPPPDRGPGRPPPDGPRQDRGPGRPPPDEPPPDRGPRPGPPRRPPERLYDELDLTKSASADGMANAGQSYFIIWRPDKRVLKTSDAATPGRWPEWPGPSAPATTTPLFLQRNDERAVIVPGPRRSTILVGHSIAGELAELNTLAWRLAAASAVALGGGLLGGWWAASRALRPINAISKTASQISATQLSERIDTTRIDRELSDLARVLNATFARLEGEFARQARFTADASHELRTPLAVLYSQVELALSRPRSADEYQEALKRCLNAASRMRGLVDGLLTLARADSGRLDLERRPLDLRHLAEEIVEQHRPDAERAGIDLRAELSDRKVEITGDATFLTRVIENLVTNALRHTPKGGSVSVCVTAEKESAVLCVADTGSGIPLEDQPRIFERFFRADQARSRSSGGNGLGLAICKSVVEAHGGTIRFASQPGVQTEFVVSLPRAS
jgi:heavy metal sensor kinase